MFKIYIYFNGTQNALDIEGKALGTKGLRDVGFVHNSLTPTLSCCNSIPTYTYILPLLVPCLCGWLNFFSLILHTILESANTGIYWLWDLSTLGSTNTGIY